MTRQSDESVGVGRVAETADFVAAKGIVVGPHMLLVGGVEIVSITTPRL